MRNKGFTLVEILIVVIILAILAAIVLPRFSTASATARASMLADDIRIMRTQITVFRAQHGVAPGYVECNPAKGVDAGAFRTQMTAATDTTGSTSGAGRKYGPYMREMPTNPVNGLATVLILADNQAVPNAGDNAFGWIYQPATQTFLADTPGADDSGKPYINY